MSVPEEPTCVLFGDGQEEAERQIKLLCTRVLPGWADLQRSDMQLSRISGGISNLLVRVDPPLPLQPVAVKVFGDKTELLVDREAEKRLLLQLNAAGFGAPVVALFGNGRIEQFLTAKTLTPEEVCDPRFVAHIARRTRAFHDLQLAIDGAAAPAPAAAATVAAATDTDGQTACSSAPASSSACMASGSVSGPSQWETLFGWLAMAETLSFPDDPAKQAAYDKVDFRAMRTELTALREMCERVGSPRVLCHNDLLPGNMLVVQMSQTALQPTVPGEGPLVNGLEGTSSGAGARTAGAEDAVASTADGTAGDDVLAGGTLQFIDFEYSCYGPRGFDWGNHFNEYAGFDCVYDRFPAPDQQKAFFRHYLKPGELQQLAAELFVRDQHRPHRPCGGSTGTTSSNSTAEGLVEEQDARGGFAGASHPAAAAVATATAAELAAAEATVLDRLVAEACVFALASHALWAVWSFIQARYSPIDFDYLDYSRMRWAEYHRRKGEFFEMVERLFPAAQ